MFDKDFDPLAMMQSMHQEIKRLQQNQNYLIDALKHQAAALTHLNNLVIDHEHRLQMQESAVYSLRIQQKAAVTKPETQ